MENTYQLVADRIIEQMAQGVIPWQKPWIGAEPAISYVSRKAYSMINQLLLGRGGEWLTWNQIQALNGHVIKGAKGRPVVFYKPLQVTDEVLVDGEKVQKIKTIPLLKHYTVFHIEDCEGIKSKIEPVEAPEIPLQPVDEAEKVISAYFEREACTLSIENSNDACYVPSLDKVIVPELSQYAIVEEYYSTLFHEMTHSTGHADRLARDLSGGFGSNNYGREELVAEIGAAFLCAKIGLDSEKAFNNSVAYLQNWSNAIKADPKMIVWASSRAERAANFILTGDKGTAAPAE